MSYKTIHLILLLTIFQIDSLAQCPKDSLLQNLRTDVYHVIKSAIENKAFPGCVIYASNNQGTILSEGFGHHTYDSLLEVMPSDLYDLASITKVTASTLALMKLYEQGSIDLDASIDQYVTGLRWSKVGKVTLREALAHQGGLEGWVRFYENIQKRNGKFKSRTISDQIKDGYTFEIKEGMYLHQDFYHKWVKKYIRKSKVVKDPEYQYSGLFFYLVPEMVSNLSKMNFEAYLKFHFYDSLGLSTIQFNPMDAGIDFSRIVPTEVDTFFRHEPIHGKVHDEGAILMGGVSGNAGQFGTAEELAVIFSMLMNGGEMDSVRYLQPSTIDLFTTGQYPNNNNRRGLGFDKPLLQYDEIKSSVAKSASVESYGHTGFTGTLVWADPEEELLFIFLSNRVYPNRDHRMIYELNVRPIIHQLIYDYQKALKLADCVCP